MSPDSSQLLALAEAVADGRAVDWAAESGSLPAADRALVDQLRLLAGVGEVHRTTATTGEVVSIECDELPIGDAPRKVDPQPKETDRINLTDPQSSFMPLYTGGYAAGFNAQMAVTGEGSGLIVATQVCQQANDRCGIKTAR